MISDYRLKQHMDQYHTAFKPVCKVCGKMFPNKAEQRKHSKTCFKKENKLKYQNKENENPKLTADTNGIENPPCVDSSADGKGTETLADSECAPILASIPLNSEDSPTLVESIPVTYQVLSFNDF